MTDTVRHGTYLGYLTDGCHNECCRAAWRQYQNDRSRAIAYGRHEPRTRTDPAKARAKILQLRAAGLSCRTIAAATGVSETVLEVLEHGGKRWIYPQTERRILAFDGVVVTGLRDRARIDSTGTVRRLRALAAIGWSWTDLAERLGCTESNVSAITREKRTRAATARAVADLYAHLWDKPAPDGYRRTRALLWAERNGWAPPMAWDDDTIDDPAAEADLGAKTARPHGGTGRPAAEVIEDIEWLLDIHPHMTAAQIADRLGYADESGVYNPLRAERGNRPDLAERLARNAEVAA